MMTAFIRHSIHNVFPHSSEDGFVFFTFINAAKEGIDGCVAICMDQNVKSSHGLVSRWC